MEGRGSPAPAMADGAKSEQSHSWFWLLLHPPSILRGAVTPKGTMPCEGLLPSLGRTRFLLLCIKLPSCPSLRACHPFLPHGLHPSLFQTPRGRAKPRIVPI